MVLFDNHLCQKWKFHTGMAQMLLTFSQSHGCIGDRLDAASGDTAGLSSIGDAGQVNDKYDIARIVACGLDHAT